MTNNEFQQEWLHKIHDIYDYFSLPKHVQEVIIATTEEAATKYMNAGYSGSQNDGGAEEQMYRLIAFLDGYHQGRVDTKYAK